ncbi:MAG TPA: hypothetical protein VI911_11520 [Patescibacteria group bacterium]|nr:hypothetical protein [Patescibacteria group bacterium]
MKDTTEQILKLFFDTNETICVSSNKYGYHSVCQSSLNGEITLISPNDPKKTVSITESDINLMAINPISGFRKDENVTAFRSFLVEIDDGPLPEQQRYIDSMEMPYSVCIFSGNKSLHYGIVLNEDLPDYGTWRIYAEWILNIMNRADQMTKNPSRSIRFPGNIRHDGAKLPQQLIKLSGRIPLNRLNIWLSKYPQCKPMPIIPKIPSSVPSVLDIPPWILEELQSGITNERNNTWFRIAMTLASKNFLESEIISILEPYFTEQRDFKYQEWLTSIQSAIKRSQKENL